MNSMWRLLSHTPVVLLLLSVATLFSSTSISAQTITSVSGCTLNADNRTSHCTPATVISIGGESFLASNRQHSLSITVDSANCGNARYVNSTLLTCRLPATPRAGRAGQWLNVTAAWKDSNRTEPFTGVSYAVGSSSSSSTGAAAVSSSSAPSTTGSSTAPPPSSVPTITAVRGCVDVGPSTVNCTFSSRLTVIGQNFGERGATVLFTLAQTPSPTTYVSNATTVICAVPTQQYEPFKSLPIRLQTSSGVRSAMFDGVAYNIIYPVVTSLRSERQRGSTLRVYPGATITVTGSSFPTNGNVLVVLNKTAYTHGSQYLGSATVLSTTELTATLPMNINADVQLNVPLPLFVTTYYSYSAPFTPGVVILSPATVSSSSSSTGGAAPGPTITSISGCEDDGNRTRSCLMYQHITLTITGRNFPAQLDRIYIGNNASPSAYCTPNTQYTLGTITCNTPAESWMVNQVYQVRMLWKNGANATFYGLYFTDRLSAPTVESVSGAGCEWNGTAGENCQRGNNAWLTITGQHFPLYLAPNISVGGSSCSMRNNAARIKDRLVCRVTDNTLPANTYLPLRISFSAASTQSLDYNVLSFRAVIPSSTGGRGNGGTAGGSRLSLEDELIIALLSTTMAVLLLVGIIFGVTYRRLRAARSQQTSGDGPWNEMVGDGSRGFRMGDLLDEQPVVAAPYVPLVAQQLGGAARGQGQGRAEGEQESWEGIPSPR